MANRFLIWGMAGNIGLIVRDYQRRGINTKRICQVYQKSLNDPNLEELLDNVKSGRYCAAYLHLNGSEDVESVTNFKIVKKIKGYDPKFPVYGSGFFKEVYNKKGPKPVKIIQNLNEELSMLKKHGIEQGEIK